MTETKETNPKDAVGIKKVPFSTVPLSVFLEAGVDLTSPAVAMTGLADLEGARKYGRFNWRVVGVRASVYVDATFRHLMASARGRELDPDSGLPEKVKALACLVILRDAILNGKCEDDRPPPSSAELRGLKPDVTTVLAGWWEGTQHVGLEIDGHVSGLDPLVFCIAKLAEEINAGVGDAPIDKLLPELNAAAARIIEKYPDAKPPYTAKDVAA